MKLNRREKLLIIVFSASIVMYFGIKLVPSFLSKSITVKEKYDEMYATYDDMFQNIKMKDIYEERRKKLQTEISDMNIPSDIRQEKIIEVLYKNLSSCGIKIVNINFSDVIPVDMSTSPEAILESGYNDEKVYDGENEGASILSMLVDIEFSSNYESVLNLIDKLQECDGNMAITNIHIIKQDYNNVYVNMDVRFYAVPTMY